MARGGKARFLFCFLMLPVLGMGACKDGALPLETPAIDDAKWQQPPSLTLARWQGDKVTLEGVAERNGRVVLVDSPNHSYAASADSEGRFEIELRVPESGLYLKPKLQHGQEFVEGQGVVFIKSGQDRLAAVLMDGDPSYRLSGQRPLDAVDTDGSMVIISGHTSSNRKLAVNVNGAKLEAEPDEGGHWALILSGGSSPMAIEVGGESYQFPGYSRAESQASIVSGGWLISRNLVGGSVQTTWFPVDK